MTERGRFHVFSIALILLIFFLPLMAMAAMDPTKGEVSNLTLSELIEQTANVNPVDDLADTLEPSQIRMDAIKQAALSYGARAGLAKRTEIIRETLDAKAGAMDQIYDFGRLLIPAPSGLMIEPPIISEGEDATLIESGGQTAAVADRIFQINRNARIVSTARNWRAYLEREWGNIDLPPRVLFPRTNEERKVWVEYLTRGWNEGMAQADEIFQADLNKLVSDYTGMVRYRKLLSMNIVSAPYALQVDRGVTGGGDEMRIGDRAIEITGPSQLMTEAYEWQPVSR
jgi:defect-in-organelle-trafficking protein DotC